VYGAAYKGCLPSQAPTLISLTQRGDYDSVLRAHVRMWDYVDWDGGGGGVV
jgi:hypothetical protein